MAGVAPLRGGSNATTIGMIIAIVVAVLLLGVLIWLFTQQEQLRSTAETATRAHERLARTNEETVARKMFPDASGGKTLVGEMTSGVKGLKRSLTGDENEPQDAAIGQFEAVLATIAAEKKLSNSGDVSSANGAVKIIETLYKHYTSERERRAKVEADLQERDAALQKEKDARESLKQEFEGRYVKLAARVDEFQKAKLAYEDTKNGEIEAWASKNAATREELESVRQAQATKNQKSRKAFSELMAMLNEQTDQLREYRGDLPTNASQLASARQSVGKIMRTLPGQSLTYINLGADDRVVLGMTFSVYSGDERIPTDGRGKATIEVVNVDRRTAECRIVSPPAPDDPILDGDSIGNLVLSRNRAKQQTFCIVGEFDIDFDDKPDPRGRSAIKAMVERWGGRVVDDVTAMTDYVIVGLEPPGEDVVSSSYDEEEEDADTMDAEEADADTEEGEEEDDWDEAEDEDSDDEDEDDEEEDEDLDDEDEDDEEEDEDSDDEDEDDEEEDEDSDDEDEDDEEEDEDSDDEDEDDEEEDEDSDDEDEDDEEEDEEEDDEDFDSGNGGSGDDQPTAPGIERKMPVDPTAGPQKRRHRSEAQIYRDAVKRARYFSVPILNQDQFFNFIGIEGTPSDMRRLRN